MSSSSFSIDRRTLDTPNLRLEHYLVPWDSEIFGKPVAQLESMQLLGDPDSASADFKEYEAWRDTRQVALEVAKLDARNLQEIAFLEARGFRWMEMLYRLQWRGDSHPAPAEGQALHIAPLQAADRDAVHALAASAFEVSRFALDPAIGPELAGRRYRTWLDNAIASGRQQLLVAHDEGGALVGFFLIEEHADSAYWHLAAVNPSQQGRGHGLRMWRQMMAWQSARGAKCIETSLSAHNLRVVGLYGRIGFRYTQAQVSLHRGGLRAGASR